MRYNEGVNETARKGAINTPARLTSDVIGHGERYAQCSIPCPLRQPPRGFSVMGSRAYRPGFRRCSSGEYCQHPNGPELPADAEHFEINASAPDGFRSQCKPCRAAIRRSNREGTPYHVPWLNPPPDGSRWCAACKQLKPLTDEYWSRHAQGKDGWRWRCKECDRATCRDWHERNRDIRVRKMREYRAAHPEIVRQSKRKWREANREYTAKYRHMRYMKNRGKYLSRTSLKRAISAGAELFTEEDIRRLYEKQGGTCLYCGCDLSGGYHVDHFIPLAVGGRNLPSNLVLACASCNGSKSNKAPWNWDGWNSAYPLEWKGRIL